MEIRGKDMPDLRTKIGRVFSWIGEEHFEPMRYACRKMSRETKMQSEELALQ